MHYAFKSPAAVEVRGTLQPDPMFFLGISITGHIVSSDSGRAAEAVLALCSIAVRAAITFE